MSFDKEFLMCINVSLAWQKQQTNDKKKKKTTEFQRKYFYQAMCLKAIQQFIKPMSVFVYFLIYKNMIKNPLITDAYMK